MTNDLLRRNARVAIPLLVRSPRSGRMSIASRYERIPVEVRGVATGSVEPAGIATWTWRPGQGYSRGEMRAFSHEGRQYVRYGRVAEFGLFDTDSGGGWIAGFPNQIAVHEVLGADPVVLPGLPLPDSVRRGLVAEFRSDAEAAARRSADRLVHDGEFVFQPLSAPVLSCHNVIRTELVQLHTRGLDGRHRRKALEHLLPVGRLEQAEAYAALFDEAGRPEIASAADEVVRRTMAEGRAFPPDDGDVEIFANTAPAELLDVIRMTRVLHGLKGDAPRERLDALAERLWTMAAVGGVGAIHGSALPAALDVIQATAEAIAEMHPLSQHRRRMTMVARYVRDLALPAVRPEPVADDLDALGGLAP